MGVTWRLRPSAEGVRIVQHGGDYLGQHAGFIMVPEREFALTVLTNSDGGPELLGDLFVDDWALRRFAGVSNLPAEPRALSRRRAGPLRGRLHRADHRPDPYPQRYGGRDQDRAQGHPRRPAAHEADRQRRVRPSSTTPRT